MILPPTLRRYRVPRSVVSDSRDLLRAPGEEGFEAVVVWIGWPLDEETAEVTGVVRPRQYASRSEEGVAVEVPPSAQLELIEAIPKGMAVLVRLHTHPQRPYHSEVDDTNMLIAHQGAVSIVVPDFAKDPIRLPSCSVNVLDHEKGWQELSDEETARRFTLI